MSRNTCSERATVVACLAFRVDSGNEARGTEAQTVIVARQGLAVQRVVDIASSAWTNRQTASQTGLPPNECRLWHEAGGMHAAFRLAHPIPFEIMSAQVHAHATSAASARWFASLWTSAIPDSPGLRAR
jgi:hypothetical protein